MTRPALCAASLALVAALSACGGGDEPTAAPAPSTVPSTAAPASPSPSASGPSASGCQAAQEALRQAPEVDPEDLAASFASLAEEAPALAEEARALAEATRTEDGDGYLDAMGDLVAACRDAGHDISAL